MKLSVFTVLLGDRPLAEACAYLAKSGVQAVEIGVGGHPGKKHADPKALLADDARLAEFRAAIEGNGLEIAALSCHGNAVHPDPAIAKEAHSDFVDACRLAERLGVSTVVTFGGCPGGCASDRTPNWVTCPWPDDFSQILKYQWDDVLAPYWEKAARQAADHGVTRIALEMHPGFAVYNPETCLRLRETIGPAIGANFDPSHLFWQGIDPAKAIRAMEGAIYHFHAKDTKIDPLNAPVNGVLDNKNYRDEIHRSWIFRSVGFGHDMQVWRHMMSNLRMTGYDGAISIEHEDSLMSVDEGLQKAIAFLKEAMIFEGTTEAWWA